MIKAYVAGKFEEKDEARKLMADLGRLGVSITHDWTVFDINNDDKSECAIHDANGVLDADFLAVVADKHLPYKGSYVEFGIALGRNIPVYVIGDGMDGCVFIKHPNIKKFLNKKGFLDFYKKTYRGK
jgi:hypothetical protein